MALIESTSYQAVSAAAAKFHDLEFEIGALASRHGLSVDCARGIIAKCGLDLGCIDEEARKNKALA